MRSPTGETGEPTRHAASPAARGPDPPIFHPGRVGERRGDDKDGGGARFVARHPTALTSLAVSGRKTGLANAPRIASYTAARSRRVRRAADRRRLGDVIQARRGYHPAADRIQRAECEQAVAAEATKIAPVPAEPASANAARVSTRSTMRPPATSLAPAMTSTALNTAPSPACNHRVAARMGSIRTP